MECPALPKPEKCGKNEHYQECGNGCQPLCSQQDRLCSQQCDTAYAGCYCKAGHFRNAKHQCVPQMECPDSPKTAECGQNERYQKCGNGCQPLCSQPDRMCTAQCDSIFAGCYCEAGYYRNAFYQCVPMSKCPPTPSQPTFPTLAAEDESTVMLTIEAKFEEVVEDVEGVIDLWTTQLAEALGVAEERIGNMTLFKGMRISQTF